MSFFWHVTITHPKGGLHKKRVQLPQDWFDMSIWPRFVISKHQYGCCDAMWKYSMDLSFIFFRCYALIFTHVMCHASASCYLFWTRLVIQLCINKTTVPATVTSIIVSYSYTWDANIELKLVHNEVMLLKYRFYWNRSKNTTQDSLLPQWRTRISPISI